MDLQLDKSALGHLDFDSEINQFNQLPPLPNEIIRAGIANGKAEPSRSAMVETLMSQIEDLNARLKVNLRRLDVLDQDNQKLARDNENLRQSISAYTDQVLILKEKDQMWKQKAEAAIFERDQAVEKAQVYEVVNAQQGTELTRFQKFQDKLKNQIKPYIQNLKSYSKSLEHQNETLKAQLESQEAMTLDLKKQTLELTKNFQMQTDNQSRHYTEVVGHYEEEVFKLKAIASQIEDARRLQETQFIQLERTQERLVQVENENIALLRNKEETRTRLENELHRANDRFTDIVKQNQKLGVENSDLKLRNSELTDRTDSLETQKVQAIEQLESLRFMWNSKNEENEKLKAASGALERLNFELSYRVNELRAEVEHLKTQR